MVLALAATALVALALLSDLIVPRIDELWSRYKARRQRAPSRPSGKSRIGSGRITIGATDAMVAIAAATPCSASERWP